MAESLYGPSFLDSSSTPTIFIVDATVMTPVAPRVRAEVGGQYDAGLHKVRFYSVSVTRDLHCWELNGTYHRFMTGEYRFGAALSVKAFPQQRLPLLGL